MELFTQLYLFLACTHTRRVRIALNSTEITHTAKGAPRPVSGSIQTVPRAQKSVQTPENGQAHIHTHTAGRHYLAVCTRWLDQPVAAKEANHLKPVPLDDQHLECSDFVSLLGKKVKVCIRTVAFSAFIAIEKSLQKFSSSRSASVCEQVKVWKFAFSTGSREGPKFQLSFFPLSR